MNNIDQIINELTLDEKVSLLSGFNSWYTNKIERLNIPSIKMSDGPNGVRGDSNSGKSSACFPCAISLGSTWDLNLINNIGIALEDQDKQGQQHHAGRLSVQMTKVCFLSSLAYLVLSLL